MIERTRVALDTHMLAYAEGVNGQDRKNDAAQVIGSLDAGDIVVPVQALGELFNVLTRKAKWPAIQAKAAVQTWSCSYDLSETSDAVLTAAVQLATVHQLSIWDAIIFAAAAQARCATLLSGDMQHGFAWRGTTVLNPFAAP